MSRKVLCLAAALGLAGCGAVFAVFGIPDLVPAGTLLVPLFETGIDSAVNPHDTLLTVRALSCSPDWIHWHYWTVDGAATALHGNVLLASNATWSVASRDLILSGPPAAQEALADGPFFRGFVTIDLVTDATSLNPREAGYPIAQDNCLSGHIYYTRLSQGSANGLPMVPIEWTTSSPAVPSRVRGFYRVGDEREAIDIDARMCAHSLSAGISPCLADLVPGVGRTDFRVFGSTPLSGASRLVVFAWTLDRTEGPSEICQALGTCSENYTYLRFDETGAIQANTTVTLPHVVNVLTVVAPQSGAVSIRNIPSINNDTQFYAFSFNSAAPAGNPLLTWDAIFEATIKRD